MIANKLGLDSPTPETTQILTGLFREHMARSTTGTELRYQTLVPNLYITVETFKKMWMDAAIGIGFYIATNGSVESIAIAFTRAIAALKFLSDDESELVHVILHLSRGHAYETPVSETTIRASYQDATLSLDDVLDKLVKRGVAVRDDGYVRLIF